MFTAFDGTTTSPNSFSGPIGKKVGEPVTNWPIEDFKFTPNRNFPILSNEIINDLSADQYYAYTVC